jgi:hypothetical protein
MDAFSSFLSHVLLTFTRTCMGRAWPRPDFNAWTSNRTLVTHSLGIRRGLGLVDPMTSSKGLLLLIDLDLTKFHFFGRSYNNIAYNITAGVQVSSIRSLPTTWVWSVIATC